MNTKTLYYLPDHMDEDLPCAPTLEGWAEWLSGCCSPPLDGDKFALTVTECSNHKATLLAGGGIHFNPPLPTYTTSFALISGVGEGWFPEDMVSGNPNDLREEMEGRNVGEHWVAALVDQPVAYRAIYRTDPVRLLIDPSGVTEKEPDEKRLTETELEELVPVQSVGTYLHRKTGNKYLIVTTGLSSNNLTPMVAYRRAGSSVVWFRSHAEFNDGRFILERGNG